MMLQSRNYYRHIRNRVTVPGFRSRGETALWSTLMACFAGIIASHCGWVGVEATW